MSELVQIALHGGLREFAVHEALVEKRRGNRSAVYWQKNPAQPILTSLENWCAIQKEELRPYSLDRWEHAFIQAGVREVQGIRSSLRRASDSMKAAWLRF